MLVRLVRLVRLVGLLRLCRFYVKKTKLDGTHLYGTHMVPLEKDMLKRGQGWKNMWRNARAWAGETVFGPKLIGNEYCHMQIEAR